MEGSNKSKLKATFPHHKNEARWDYMPITFEVPSSLTTTLMPWIVHGPQLMAPKSPYLFCVNNGAPYGAANVSQWFNALLATYNQPFKFCPRDLRHIFVDERMGGVDGTMVDGPSNQGAAYIMGNSVERWAISYDRNLHSRNVRMCVEAMESWREELATLAQL